MKLGFRLSCILGVAWLLASPWGVPAEGSEKELKATTIASDLDNPSGLAIQPKTGDLFIAARPGVFRVELKETPKLHTEISGFNTDIYGKGPKYNIGPLGVAFINEHHLIVGNGGDPDATETVQVYHVGVKPLAKPLTPADAKAVLGPIKPSPQSVKGEGNYYGVAVSGKAIYITCNGDDTKGWIAKAELKHHLPEELKLAIATKEATGVDAPVAITLSPHDKELVVGQMGEMNVAGDSLLTTYDPETGKLIKSLKTGLNDIAGLAYSPKTGKLYAVDFAWVDPTKGGLFRLDVEGDTVKPVKLLSLDKPTALAFDHHGHLYIAAFGAAKEGEKPTGSVIRVGGDL
jgi:DNA-binding beta-propeller fold protein YncE